MSSKTNAGKELQKSTFLFFYYLLASISSIWLYRYLDVPLCMFSPQLAALSTIVAVLAVFYGVVSILVFLDLSTRFFLSLDRVADRSCFSRSLYSSSFALFSILGFSSSIDQLNESSRSSGRVIWRSGSRLLFQRLFLSLVLLIALPIIFAAGSVQMLEQYCLYSGAGDSWRGIKIYRRLAELQSKYLGRDLAFYHILKMAKNTWQRGKYRDSRKFCRIALNNFRPVDGESVLLAANLFQKCGAYSLAADIYKRSHSIGLLECGHIHSRGSFAESLASGKVILFSEDCSIDRADKRAYLDCPMKKGFTVVEMPWLTGNFNAVIENRFHPLEGKAVCRNSRFVYESSDANRDICTTKSIERECLDLARTARSRARSSSRSQARERLCSALLFDGRRSCRHVFSPEPQYHAIISLENFMSQKPRTFLHLRIEEVEEIVRATAVPGKDNYLCTAFELIPELANYFSKDGKATFEKPSFDENLDFLIDSELMARLGMSSTGWRQFNLIPRRDIFAGIQPGTNIVYFEPDTSR